VGTADLLLSDSERLDMAATGAGVDVTLEVGVGLPHVYQLLLGTPEAAEATERIGKFLRTRVQLPDRSQPRSGQPARGGQALPVPGSRWHTSGMTSPKPPENPKLNDGWVDEAGDLYTWDGTEWVPFEDIPFFGPNTEMRGF
jgi:hypothetical protein